MATRSWNRVELIGNLTRDPELRYTPTGSAVCTFSIATNRTYISDGERKEEADFHRAVAWNKLAELCNQLLKKGHRVFISGRLQNRSWEGQDGQSRQTTEIVIEDMILLTPRNGVSVATEEFSGADLPKETSGVSSSAQAVTVQTTKDDDQEGTPETAKEDQLKIKKPAEKTTETAEEVDLKDEDLPF